MGRTRLNMRRDAGFTLLELLVTLLIIGVLLAIAVVAYVASTNSANAAACSQNRRALNKAIEVATCSVMGDQPDELDDLRPYVNSFDRVKVCPLDGAPLMLDRAHNQVVCPNHS